MSCRGREGTGQTHHSRQNLKAIFLFWASAVLSPGESREAMMSARVGECAMKTKSGYDVGESGATRWMMGLWYAAMSSWRRPPGAVSGSTAGAQV